MSIAGNVIACDECGCQPGVPMDPDDDGKTSLEEKVRAFAISYGWTCGYAGDYCPGGASTGNEVSR